MINNNHFNNLPYVNITLDKLLLTKLAFPAQSASLSFSFSELLFDFSTPVSSIGSTGDKLIVKAKLNDYAKLILVLQGRVTEDNVYFQTEAGSLVLEPEYESTEVEFVTNSLMAIFALAGMVSVALPSINLNLKLCFDLPPREISELLKKRNTAYKSMITENSGAFRLPKSAWNSFIQDLISLENNLCDLLFEKYNKLAEASLKGLSEEQKEAIRPRKETKDLT